jgi:hypothetical protein
VRTYTWTGGGAGRVVAVAFGSVDAEESSLVTVGARDQVCLCFSMYARILCLFYMMVRTSKRLSDIRDYSPA